MIRLPRQYETTTVHYDVLFVVQVLTPVVPSGAPSSIRINLAKQKPPVGILIMAYALPHNTILICLLPPQIEQTVLLRSLLPELLYGCVAW